MSEPDWDALRAELHQKADLVLAHALVHYIHRGHPYEMQMRSANAVQWIKHGQYLLLVRLDDSNMFWRIRDELEQKIGPTSSVPPPRSAD